MFGINEEHALFSLTESDKEKVFALQPMGQYNAEMLEVLCKKLRLTFEVKVITLKPLNIPDRFRSKYNEKYSADSLLVLLSEVKKDSIVKVIGVTNKKIYTSEKAKSIKVILLPVQVSK